MATEAKTKAKATKKKPAPSRGFAKDKFETYKDSVTGKSHKIVVGVD